MIISIRSDALAPRTVLFHTCSRTWNHMQWQSKSLKKKTARTKKYTTTEDNNCHKNCRVFVNIFLASFFVIRLDMKYVFICIILSHCIHARNGFYSLVGCSMAHPQGSKGKRWTKQCHLNANTMSTEPVIKLICCQMTHIHTQTHLSQFTRITARRCHQILGSDENVYVHCRSSPLLYTTPPMTTIQISFCGCFKHQWNAYFR